VHYAPNGALISNIHVLDKAGRIVNVLTSGETYRYCYDVLFTDSATGVYFGMVLKTITGFEIGGMGSHENHHAEPFIEANSSVRITFWFRNMLQPGTYFGNAGVYSMGSEHRLVLHRILDAYMFRVMNPPSMRWTLSGVVDLSYPPRCQLAVTPPGQLERAPPIAGQGGLAR
jgi:lipopolysaccharide transport system ATP-binding protein